MRIVTGAPATTPFSPELARFQHVVTRVAAALNQDIAIPRDGSPVNGGWLNQGLAASWALVDGRLVKQLKPTLAQGQESIFRGLSQVYDADFRQDFAAGGAGALENVASAIQPLASVFRAWLRKFDNVSPPTARQFFGFRNTASGVLTATKTVARTGLIGDGVNGFRFGSVNAPDGGAGTNGFADIDAGSVQPALLVNPGLAWFSVTLKAIPASPTQTGRIGCYLDGVLVATYSTPANLPRGTGAVNRQYQPIEPCVFADFDGVTQLNGFYVHRAEFWYDADLTL